MLMTTFNIAIHELIIIAIELLVGLTHICVPWRAKVVSFSRRSFNILASTESMISTQGAAVDVLGWVCIKFIMFIIGVPFVMMFKFWIGISMMKSRFLSPLSSRVTHGFSE